MSAFGWQTQYPVPGFAAQTQAFLPMILFPVAHPGAEGFPSAEFPRELAAVFIARQRLDRCGRKTSKDALNEEGARQGCANRRRRKGRMIDSGVS